jgi:hypothetical protein
MDSVWHFKFGNWHCRVQVTGAALALAVTTAEIASSLLQLAREVWLKLKLVTGSGTLAFKLFNLNST